MRPVGYYLRVRERAAARGDWGYVRALDADLAQHGVPPYERIPAKAAERGPALETTQHLMPETAVPTHRTRNRSRDT